MKTILATLAVILALAATARAQSPAPPALGDEQEWVRQVASTVPEGELAAAAAQAEALGVSDPLKALAAKYRLDSPPPWLKDRVQSQASAVTLAALGDSVTAATASCAFPYVYCPGNSWTTGDVSGSIKRALEAQSGREVRGFLAAVPGVTIRTVPAEAFVVYLASWFGLDVERITLLIGHNDPGVCGAPDPGADAVFAREYATALRILGRVARERGARLFVSGLIDVPAVARYESLTPDGAAKTCRELWAETGRCSAFIDHRHDPGEIARVEAQVDDDDGLLERGAAGLPWVRYAPTFTRATRAGFPDPAAELSPLDCFHPSAAGQSRLGAAAWSGDAGVPGIASFFALPPATAAAPRSPAPKSPAPELRAELDSWRSDTSR